MISILILAHNAPNYVTEVFESLPLTIFEDGYETVVVDNASDEPTKALLAKYKADGRITKLITSPVNTLFGEGNNIAFAQSDPKASHICLLNTDVQLRSPDWLNNLYLWGTKGGMDIVGYGWVPNPPRPDGWCCLLRREVYVRYGGIDDVQFPWYFGLSHLIARWLRDTKGKALALAFADKFIHHYGHGSHPPVFNVHVPMPDLQSWFAGTDVRLNFKLDDRGEFIPGSSTEADYLLAQGGGHDTGGRA